jgi:sporulation protein YlmC with PRC-barrel domain
VRLSDLLGATVITESGKPLGHVVDARGEEREDDVEVTELLVGRRAFLERLLGGRRGYGVGRVGPHAAVPWEAVVALEPGRHVVVRDGTEPTD